MNISPKTQAMLDALYEGRDHVQLTIGMLKDGEIETIHYNEKKEIVPEKLIYPVGSIGKPMTATMLAKHMAEGDIHLEDTLDQFIPGLPEGYYPTILRLMTHHSGYGSAPFSFFQMLMKLAKMNDEKGILHANPFRGTLGEKEMMEILKTKRLKDQDYKFEYSNFSYGVLGYILGKLEGTDYFTATEAFVKELGLEDTSLQNASWTGYDKKGNPCQPWQWEKGDIIAPAGALLSSMEDLLKFAKMNMDGTLPYVDMLHQKYAEGEKTFDQGLAWRIKKGTDISFHVGSAGAFSCILAMDRKKKQAAVIGLNYALVDIEEAAFSMLD